MKISNKLNITYNVKLPTGEKSLRIAESNAVDTEILSYAVSKTISSDKTTIKEGEKVHITVTITNNSAAKLFDNFFTIQPPNGASFVEGSVKVNGIVCPDFDPVKGFKLPDLSPNETVVIKYDIKADNQVITKPITHFATLKYSVNDQIRGNVSYAENTDIISLDVIRDKIEIAKSVDKSIAVRGEKLHYTISITNISSTAKSDLLFQDPIPSGTRFVAGSVMINGVGYPVYNPNTGFTISSLAPNEVLIIEFDVKVN